VVYIDASLVTPITSNSVRSKGGIASTRFKRESFSFDIGVDENVNTVVLKEPPGSLAE